MRLSRLFGWPDVPGVLLCTALAVCLAGPSCSGPAPPAEGAVDDGAGASATDETAKAPAAGSTASPESGAASPPVAHEVKSPSDAAKPAAGGTPQEAWAVLDRMLAAYRGAHAYRDRGVIIMRIHGTEGDRDNYFDAHLEFQRPNLLRSELQQAWPTLFHGTRAPQVLVVADGKKIYGKEENHDGQVVVQPDPARITVPELYSTEVLTSLLQVGITGQSVVLDLLTAEKPMQELDRQTAQLQTPSEIDGRTYDRVTLGPAKAPVTLWIDRKTSLLRRVEYDTAELRKMFPPDTVTGIELTAEFESASFDPPADAQRFSWQQKPDEHYVRSFVDPPDPKKAPELLGQPAPDFSFVNAAGETSSVRSLAGKITVIDIFASWCGPCMAGMPGLEEVRQKYAKNDQVRFLALSIDNPDVPDAKIADIFKKLDVQVPWVRSTLEQPGELGTLLHFGGIPGMLILGADGRVQVHHEGFDPDAAKNLPLKIDALLAGEDLTKKVVQAWEAETRAYNRKLELASVDILAATIDIPRAQIADRSEPKTFRLRPLWTAADVKSPGNILVVPSAGRPPRLLVIDNWHEIVELDAAGKQVARHKDLAPGNPPLSFLRTAVGRDGRRLLVAGAIGQQQIHVFDDRWKRLLSYPAEGSAKIYDVLPADLGGSGEPQLNIAFFGVAGVHGVALDGRRLWRNRSLENVTSLSVTGPNAAGRRRLLCVEGGGTLVPIRNSGQADAPIGIVGQAITRILSADLSGNGKLEYCAIAAKASGDRAVVGLRIDENGGEVIWEHPLPPGDHERPVEVLSTAHLVPGQPGQWLVAGVDGSVHIIAHDGSTQDQFNSGAPLTGLASATFDGQSVLLVAHPNRLSAMAVEKLP